MYGHNNSKYLFVLQNKVFSYTFLEYSIQCFSYVRTLAVI